jgi:hypothetical protein
MNPTEQRCRGCKSFSLYTKKRDQVQKHFEDSTGVRLYKAIGYCLVKKKRIFERVHEPVDVVCENIEA